MIDTISILVDYLCKEGTPLHSLVGRNVFVGQLPETYTDDTPAILITTRGGSSEKKTPLFRHSIQFKIYGGSPYILDAKQVYSHLFDHMHSASNESFNAGTLSTAYEEIPGQELYDPDTSFAYVLAFFTVLFKPNS